MSNTPTIPSWIREFLYSGYTNVYSFLDNCPRLYGTETLFGDWSAEVLLLAKDGAPTHVIKSLSLKEGQSAWRHAQRELGDIGGWRTNERLTKLVSGIPGPKLYGSATANLLFDDPRWSRTLSEFKTGQLHDYLVNVLRWVISCMPNLRVIACLGEHAWYLTSCVLGNKQAALNYLQFRNNHLHISGEMNGKIIVATSHYHPAARVSTSHMKANWDLISNILSSDKQKV